MDIIDIVLARALTPQGQIEQYATLAQQAVTQANAAVTAATSASETASAAAEQIDAIMEDIDVAIDAETKKLLVDITDHAITDGIGYDLITTYPDNTARAVENVIKLYTKRGQNVDGGMTQKAITNEIIELERKINQGGGGGGSTNLGPENAGKIVIIGVDGNIISGTTTEEDIIKALIAAGIYDIGEAIGLDLNYEEKTFKRIQKAVDLEAGTDFDKFTMYGGRKRCNVNNSGEITAWYGDPTYAEDGSNGQVMVYQPKFYYSRIPVKTETVADGGEIVQEEMLLISDMPLTGFKLHPLFINADGETVEYALLSAYEGSLYKSTTSEYDIYDNAEMNLQNGDCLSSIAGVKPISGWQKNLNANNAELLAASRGANWHITNLACESANQMLQMIEYGMPNGQYAGPGKGVVSWNAIGEKNGACKTGDTSFLGNSTGVALEATRWILNNDGSIASTTTSSSNGYCSISYRGVENPWGNIWRIVAGINVKYDASKHKGKAYICSNFNYLPTSDVSNQSNYTELGFYLSNSNSWVSNFGLGNSKLDWAFIPIRCDNTANSALPIGDNYWSPVQVNDPCMCLMGGLWSYGDNCGPFYYAFDKLASAHAYGASARLMYIPTKNQTYEQNLESWRQKML